MRVFVAGATGVLGRRAVAELVRAGHAVTGTARHEAGAAGIRGAGGSPATVDLFDAEAVRRAVAGHDAVLNLATHIPPGSRALLPGAWRENDRIRREGARNLVDAAIAAGTRVYVQESIAFTYADRGAEWIDETAPADPAGYVRSALEAEAQAERFAAAGGAGVALRFGLFYGPDSTHTREMASAARRGWALLLGRADAYVSPITTDDAARAAVAALRVPSGLYNVADDEPVTHRAYADALGAAMGRALRLPPAWLARFMGGIGDTLGRSQRVSNRRFREASGWTPADRSVREGWPRVLAAM